MNKEEEDLDRVRQHADQLAEHFDSVQIFATRHEAGEEDGTINVSYGAGNWFSRVGQIYEWLIKAKERTCVFVRGEEEE